jgi:hypothetical protein
MATAAPVKSDLVEAQDRRALASQQGEAKCSIS